jgi:hypothetical protein
MINCFLKVNGFADDRDVEVFTDYLNNVAKGYAFIGNSMIGGFSSANL